MPFPFNFKTHHPGAGCAVTVPWSILLRCRDRGVRRDGCGRATALSAAYSEAVAALLIP